MNNLKILNRIIRLEAIQEEINTPTVIVCNLSEFEAMRQKYPVCEHFLVDDIPGEKTK